MTVSIATAAGAASAAAQPHVTSVAVTDSAANVLVNLASLQVLAAAGELAAITLTGGGTPILVLTAAQLMTDAAALAKIAGPYSIVVTGVTAAGAASTAAQPHVTSVGVTDSITNVMANLAALNALVGEGKLAQLTLIPTHTVTGVTAAGAASAAAQPGVTSVAVTDSAADVLANLAALQVLAAAGKLAEISLTDSGTPILAMTAAQIQASAAALAEITGPCNITETGVAAAGATAAAAQAAVTSVAVADSAVNVLANLPALQILAAGHELATITLTDGGTPTLAMTAAQIKADATVLASIASPYNIVETGVTAAGATAAAAQAHVPSVAVTDSAANVLANLAALQVLAADHELATIALTNTTTATLVVTAAQMATDAAALAEISSPYKITETGVTAAGATAAAQQAHVTSVAVADSAANVVANLPALQVLAAAGELATITLTDGGTPNLGVTAAEVETDAAALAKVAGPYTIVEATPTIPQPTEPGQIVGLILQNPTSGVLAAREITFGQEFSAQLVPAGRQLVALINGVTVPVQMDVKTTNPDGSVQMAVLTLQQPTLAADSSTNVMLELAPVGTSSGTALSLSSLNDANYSLTIDLDLRNANGTTTAFHIDAAQALQAALQAGSVSYWLQGPQATQARVDVPISGSLHVVLDITMYAGGATSTDVEFDNDLAMTSGGGTVTYNATIRQNGATVLQQNNITQYQYQTWDQVVASNGPSLVNVQHDVAALEKTGLIQNYDLSAGVQTSVIAAEGSAMQGAGFGILGNAGITQDMPETGGRADIGPTTEPNTIWLMTQNATAEQYALAQADAAGSVPWHLASATTGTYLTTTQYPTLWADNRGGTGGTTGLTQPLPDVVSAANQQSGWSVDPAHQPDLSYDAYLLTGSRYDLDQLNAQASYDILAMSPAAGDRAGGQDLVVNGNVQVRMQAWDLRDIEEAAVINPANSPLKSYFVQAANNNFNYLVNTLIPAETAAEGPAYGWLSDASATLKPWEQDYMSLAVTEAAEMGNQQAVQVLQWESNFIVGSFLQAQNGFDPHDGVAYQLNAGPNLGSYSSLYQTWAQIDAASGPSPSAADFSGGWAALEYTGYQQWALATLAGDITVLQSPQALQAYGWLLANTQVTAAFEAANPTYDIVPRLSDGNLLGSNMVFIHNDTGTAPVTLQGTNSDQLIYEAGSAPVTIVGGTGINILFGGSGPSTLVGGGSNDYLFGGSGPTAFQAGSGNDYMQTGSGAATFDLSAADIGNDIIAGFRIGLDHLSVAGIGSSGPASLSGLIAGATQNAGGSVVLHLSASHEVTLDGVGLAQMSGSLFS